MLRYQLNSTDELLQDLLVRYERTKRPIEVDFRRLIPNMATERATHLIHPYPAKLLVHIPYFFLANELLSKPGDVVLDPFCGSGTVLLESYLANRSAIGADCNPLARLITTVKLTQLPDRFYNTLNRLHTRIPSIPTKPEPDVVNINYWYDPRIILELQCIQEAIEKTRDSTIRNFFLVCFSVCARRLSFSDPRVSVPVRLRNGSYPKHHKFHTKTLERLQWLSKVDVQNEFFNIVERNHKRFLKFDKFKTNHDKLPTIISDARNLNSINNGSQHLSNTGLANESISLIITSPPYPGAQKYIRSSSLSLGWLNLSDSSNLRHLKGLCIGREEFQKKECQSLPEIGITHADNCIKRISQKSIVRATIAATYLHEMKDALSEAYRVLRPKGFMVLVAGNNTIAGEPFMTVRYLRGLAIQKGFSVRLQLIDTIRSRGLMTKRNSTANIINREWVLLLQKDL